MVLMNSKDMLGDAGDDFLGIVRIPLGAGGRHHPSAPIKSYNLGTEDGSKKKGESGPMGTITIGWEKVWESSDPNASQGFAAGDSTGPLGMSETGNLAVAGTPAERRTDPSGTLSVAEGSLQELTDMYAGTESIEVGVGTESQSLGRTSPQGMEGGMGSSIAGMSVLTWEGDGDAFDGDRSVEDFMSTMIDGFEQEKQKNRQIMHAELVDSHQRKVAHKNAQQELDELLSSLMSMDFAAAAEKDAADRSEIDALIEQVKSDKAAIEANLDKLPYEVKVELVRLVVGEYIATTSCCFLLLPIAPRVSAALLVCRRSEYTQQ